MDDICNDCFFCSEEPDEKIKDNITHIKVLAESLTDNVLTNYQILQKIQKLCEYELKVGTSAMLMLTLALDRQNSEKYLDEMIGNLDEMIGNNE